MKMRLAEHYEGKEPCCSPYMIQIFQPSSPGYTQTWVMVYTNTLAYTLGVQKYTGCGNKYTGFRKLRWKEYNSSTFLTREQSISH